MKLACANCANAMADRHSGKDRHEKTECARTLAGAKGASGIARQIKSQIKAGSWPHQKIIAPPEFQESCLWKRLTASTV
jgi:hypothetical protein